MQDPRGRIQQRASGDKRIDPGSGGLTSCLTRQSKEGQNFLVARLFRQLSKRLAVYAFALAKRRKAFQKSRYPPGISKLNGISKVLQHNRKIPAPVPQIFDCPAAGVAPNWLSLLLISAPLSSKSWAISRSPSNVA
jgi:hypothetical protein